MHKQVGHHTKKIEFMWEGGHGPENGSQNGPKMVPRMGTENGPWVSTSLWHLLLKLNRGQLKRFLFWGRFWFQIGGRFGAQIAASSGRHAQHTARPPHPRRGPRRPHPTPSNPAPPRKNPHYVTDARGPAQRLEGPHVTPRHRRHNKSKYATRLGHHLTDADRFIGSNAAEMATPTTSEARGPHSRGGLADSAPPLRGRMARRKPVLSQALQHMIRARRDALVGILAARPGDQLPLLEQLGRRSHGWRPNHVRSS